MHKQKPPPLSFPDKVNFITIGNLEHDLDLIKECDLVIEVIVEKLEIKHQLYNKIISYLKEDTIIASNTSTLPLKRLKENLPDNIYDIDAAIKFGYSWKYGPFELLTISG